MTALIAYGIDVNSGSPEFAIVADETQARYVFPAMDGAWMDDARIPAIHDDQGLDDTPQGWMDAASYNIGLTTQITAPHEVESLAAGMGEARTNLNQARAGNPGPNLDPDPLART